MSLADALASAPREAKRGPRCGIGLTLEALDAADADALRHQLSLPSHDPDYRGSRVVAQVLAGAGHRVGMGAVQRHRRGECRCE